MPVLSVRIATSERLCNLPVSETQKSSCKIDGDGKGDGGDDDGEGDSVTAD